ncbi:protein AATF isoform X1 [Rhipicephalus sanguineus]|uniref:protein AATF isoform X1 n=1 Tax=Rhipicephalus sanguineus TaxID=34632 RepID=UPI001894A494|nr:protein AATF isoform X1 [Rhipicephalus sanguineus]
MNRVLPAPRTDSMSLLDSVNELMNTAPALVDPEDDIHEDTKARLVNKCTLDYEEVVAQKPRPRRQPQVILGDRYAGKRVSRKDLDEDGFDSDDENLQGSEVDDDDSMSDLGIGGNKDRLENSTDEEPSESEGDEEEDEGSGDHTLLATATSNQKESSKPAGMDNFSTVDVAAEVKKGKAVHSQLQIWDSVLEVRIQLQKLLMLANHFPKHEQHSLFRSAALEQDKKNGNLIGQAKSSVELVMHQLLTLQERLRDSYPEIQSIFSNVADKERNGEGEIDPENEEIPSDTEAEESLDESEAEPPEASPGKRKAGKQVHPDKPTKCRKMDACIASAAEFWKKFEPYRNATIEKWYERTRLLSGKVGRSFASLEQSPVKQIEHILMDEERLLRRTQTKRSSYKILGAQESTNDEQEQKSGTVDEEVFDDDDFYHHLLREIIERKSSNIDNPVALSRQWLEIQKLRKKVKRKVDTRASKGRKIRYDVIPKLVNFMAPLDRSTYSEEARTELFSSLFGQKKYVG